MSQHIILRSLYGLEARPSRWRDSALVLLDCQNTYRHGVLKLHGVEMAVAEAARLLRRARAADIPVFHVMHDAGEGTLYDVSADIGQISAEVAPAPGEPVIVKHHPSAFRETALDEWLRRVHCRNLVLAGFMTHVAVNATARDAFDLGYQPTIVANATATRRLPGTRGKPVPAEAMQSASLAGIADLFALVVAKGVDIPA